jgi:hypothetical protein
MNYGRAMTNRLLLVLTTAVCALVGCGAGSRDGAQRVPAQGNADTPPRAVTMAITEQRDGSPCATPCSRLHQADRLTGRCRPHVRYSSGQGVAGGLISAEFQIREESRHGCVISGYPTIQMIDRRGRQLPTHVQQRADFSAAPLRLRRGHPMYFVIQYHWQTFNAEAYCRPAPHALLLRLPGDRRTLTVPVDGTSAQLRVFTPCNGELRITAL